MYRLPPGVIQFLTSLQSGASSKALQAWEYSEAIQTDCISPVNQLIQQQKAELTEIADISRQITLQLEHKVKHVRQAESDY